jgi:hypothetical protein
MRGRALRVTSRIAYILCGLITLLTGFPYVQLRGEALPVESEWIIFVIAFAVLGGFSLVVTFLRRAWIAKLCGRERDDDRLFSVPLKLLAVFAAISYLIAVVADFAPHTWNLNPQLMFALCPLYFVKMTIDPSAMWVFFVLAPMNAAVYGSLGALGGYAWLALRK